MKKTPLIFLHGWGKKKENYGELLGLLAPKYAVYALDLPGFGEEPISQPYDLADYARFVADFVAKKRLEKVVLAGHSFGGRVAIKMAVSRPELVSKLVLIDAAGIERKSIKAKAAKWLAAITPERLKEIFRPLVGSRDYLAATPLLRETMKKVVAENLEFELPKIKAPTLIVWGENDHTTPLWQGELMHRLIQGSTLTVIPGGDHGIPYRRAGEVAEIILRHD